MTTLEDLKRLEQNIKNIDIAIEQASLNGGVSSYTLNTGQGSTSVKRATFKELIEMRNNLEYLYNEKKEHYSGENISIIRNSNVCSGHF